MRGAVPRPGLFASTDFNNNDKRVIYGRNNVYPVAAAPWLWHCRSLLQPCVADDLSVSDVLLHRRHGSPGLLCRPDVPGHPAGRRRGRRADGAGDRQYHHPLGALPSLAADRPLPFGLLCILAFYVPDFGTTGKLLYAFVTYLCLSFLYTLVNIPFCAMLPFLTSDSAERTTLSAVRILLGSLGATIVAVATLPLVGMLGKGNQQQGFLYTAVIFGVLAAFFLLVSFRNVEEKITLTGERMTLKRAWISLRANRPWWVFASNIFLMWGAFFFQTGALVYFFHYYVGNTELTAVIAGISTFVPLLGTLTVPLLARRMKKRHVYLVASAVNLLGMGIMMVSGAHVLGLIVGAVILSLGAGQRTAIYFSMQADPVDYGVWKTGINTAGILTSINGFLGKVAMAGAGAITGVLLSSSGYIANHTQSDSALLAIKACYLYIPALLILASMLWMGRFYRLDDQYEQIRADLDAGRRASPAPAPTAGESPAM